MRLSGYAVSFGGEVSALEEQSNVIVTGSENGAADTDQGAALLDSNGVILGHAHGKFFEIRVLQEEVSFEFIEDLMQVVKFAAHLFLVVREGGHAHHPVDFNVF